MLPVTKDDVYFRMNYYLLLLAMGTLPFTHVFMLPIAIAFLLVSILENNWKQKCNTLKSNNLTLPFFLIAGLFLIGCIAILYSANVGKAISDIEFKIWFFVAPLCLFPLFGRLDKKKIDIILITFCLSTLLFAIVNMTISLVDYVQSGDITTLFYIHASHWQHPSYVAMYGTITWIISTDFIVLRPIKLPKVIKILLIIAIILLPFYIFMLQSKAGLIIWGLIFLIISSIVINLKKRRPLMTTIFIIMVALLALSFFKFGHSSVNRIKDSVEQFTKDNESNPANGTTQRLAIWKTALELSVENLPFGIGTGDVKNTLLSTYKEKGYTNILQSELNCHNQYLQTTLGTGIPGLLLLLAPFVYCIVKSIKKRDIIAFLFVIIVLSNFLVESMLETQAGANFIPLMLTLLIMKMGIKPIEEK